MSMIEEIKTLFGGEKTEEEKKPVVRKPRTKKSDNIPIPVKKEKPKKVAEVVEVPKVRKTRVKKVAEVPKVKKVKESTPKKKVNPYIFIKKAKEKREQANKNN